MERWIRIVVTGQRRAHSSLAKPALNTSGSSYSVSDIRTSNATLSRDRLRNNGPRNALASLATEVLSAGDIGLPLGPAG